MLTFKQQKKYWKKIGTKFMSISKELKKIISAINIKRVVINKINKNDKTILIYRTDLIGDYLMSRNFLELIR